MQEGKAQQKRAQEEGICSEEGCGSKQQQGKRGCGEQEYLSRASSRVEGQKGATGVGR